MNCLEFRRRLAADPQVRSAELPRHRDACPECARYAVRVARFERALRSALHGPVPEGLAPRILLRQAFRGRNHAQRRCRLALAASVLLGALLAGSGLWRLAGTYAFEREIVSLVRSAPYALAATEPVNPGSVRRALGAVGMSVEGPLEGVTFASRCYFRGHLAGHLVVSSADGRVSVFLIPDAQVPMRTRIRDAGYDGVLVPAGPGTIAILATAGTPLDRFERRITAAVRWRA